MDKAMQKMFLCQYPLIFFSRFFFLKIQEGNNSDKQLVSRSDPMFYRAWSGSKL